MPRLLGSLGYPGFAYLRDPETVANPAAVLLAALQQPAVSARVTAALPWLLATFTNLDWDWLVDEAKRSNLQNRLGYLVTVAKELASTRGETTALAALREAERHLEDARLVREDTLGRSLTEAERRYLRAHRPDAAAHWNVLTSLSANELSDAL